ncbi:MAG: hypothetical protein GY730_01475 [bacterium]|nr:hypothetical protein [bacterium]
MTYDSFIKLVRKHMYVVFFEKFKNEHAPGYIERYVAKHNLLKPGFLVLNDQVHGFKRVSKNLRSLENFPIYLEFEYSENEKGEKYIEEVELYAEAKISSSLNLSDLVYLADVYNKTIIVEKVKRINDLNSESYIIYSRLGEVIQEEFMEEDLMHGCVSKSEIDLMIEVNLVSFVNFIKLMDEMLFKGKKLNTIDHLLNIF